LTWDDDKPIIKVNVKNGAGTYSCGDCCSEAEVRPVPVEEPKAELDFGLLPAWVWAIIFLTPVLLWLTGLLLMWLTKRKRARTSVESETSELNQPLETDKFDFPFGPRLDARLDALARCKKGTVNVGLFQSFLQQRTLYLRIEKDAAETARWQGTTLGQYLQANTGIMDTCFTCGCCTSGEQIRKGLYRGGWRARAAFNFFFALGLALAFGSVAVTGDIQSACTKSCTLTGSPGRTSYQCASDSSSSQTLDGGGLSLPEGSAAYFTETGLFLSLIEVPTKAGMDFVLKRATRYKSPCLLISAYIIAVLIGFGATILGIIYLSNQEDVGSFDVGNKIFFCIILSIASKLASLFAVDAILQSLLFYLPARCLLHKYRFVEAHPRTSIQSEPSSPFGKALAGMTTAIDDTEVRLSTVADVAAAGAKEAALDAGTALILQKLRPKLEPIAKKHGFEWPMIETAVVSIDVGTIENAVEDPEAFLRQLLDAGVLGAKVVALHKLRPKLEPIAKKQGVEWPMIEAAVASIDVETIEKAIDDPEAFLDQLIAAGVLGAKAIALHKLRPKLEPITEKKGISWDQVEAAIELIEYQDTAAIVEQINVIAEDPAAFVEASLPALMEKLHGKMEDLAGDEGEEENGDSGDGDTDEKSKKAAKHVDKNKGKLSKGNKADAKDPTVVIHVV